MTDSIFPSFRPPKRVTPFLIGGQPCMKLNQICLVACSIRRCTRLSAVGRTEWSREFPCLGLIVSWTIGPKDFRIQLSVVVLDVGIKLREYFFVVARIQVVDASCTVLPENEANNFASADTGNLVCCVFQIDNPVFV
jgi:hypothetical protein